MRIAVGNLPDAALHRIFQLFCDGCPPETPGTCWLAPVCRRWRALACGVKGLRVLFQSNAQEQVESFCVWLRRHAPQVKVLALTNDDHVPVLAALSEAAAAAAGLPQAPAAAVRRGSTAAAAAAAAAATAAATATPTSAGGGGARATPPGTAAGEALPLPLQRLVILCRRLLYHPRNDALWSLLGALPHLQHLNLWLKGPVNMDDPDDAAKVSSASSATAGSWAPFQHSTALTSLVLSGPSCGRLEATDAAHVQLLAQLPPTLRSLSWTVETQQPGQLAFDRLTALTRLDLGPAELPMHGSFPDDAFTAMRQLRELELHHVLASEEMLVAHQEQLVGLTITDMTHVLPQLTRLRSLSFDTELDHLYPALLQQAPQLQALSLTLFSSLGGPSAAWGTPWALQHYKGLTGLQRLSLSVDGAQAAPPALCALTQLKQLEVDVQFDDMEPMTSLSWVCALAGLVNLEVLVVPAVLTACWHPWLTGLTRLAVVEVSSTGQTIDTTLAAAHISRLLAPEPQNRSSPDSRSSSSSRGGDRSPLQVVCLSDDGHAQALTAGAQLHRAVVAAVPVLAPTRHLFQGGWYLLHTCGVELWPAPVAARLQQLV